MQNNNILQLIKSRKGKFPQQQNKIATFLLKNQEKAAFLTATQLAREIGVSQPTVIRFAQALGFERYGLFTEAFQNLLKEELTSTERLSISLGQDNSIKEGNLEIISREVHTLSRLASSFPQVQFYKLVKQICGSRTTFILGTRGSASLAQYFAYFLGKVKRNVYALTSGATDNYDRLLSVGAKDVIVALAFPRYPRETIEMSDFCRKRELNIVGITDQFDSPLAKITDYAIVIPITFSTIFDSYSSAFCFFNMIVTEVGRTNRRESQPLSKSFETLAKELKIFL